jgi:hypothetical protein
MDSDRFPSFFLAVLVAAFLAPAPGGSGECGAYAQALSRAGAIGSQLDSLVRDLDNQAGLAETPRRLLSLRRNAEIAVGGEIRAVYAHTRAKYAGANPSGDNPAPTIMAGNSRLADLKIATARLTVEARIKHRWRAFFEINLQGFNGFAPSYPLRNANPPGSPSPGGYMRRGYRDQMIGQAYVELLKAGHSGFGFRLGLLKPAFGLRNRPDLFGQSFLDAPELLASHLMEPANRAGGLRLPHASRFLDPVAALMFSYELRDIVVFEGGIFQERELYRRRAAGRGNFSPPRSWQIGVSMLPLEGWELSTVFRNRHSRTRGLLDWADSPFRPDFRANLVSGGTDPSWTAAGQWSDNGAGPGFGSRKNEQALAVGLSAEVPGIGVLAQLEYAHGWNQGFNRHINSDGVTLGLSGRLSPFLTLFGQAEWLHVKDRSFLTGTGGRDVRNHRLYRFLLGVEQYLAAGLTLEAGWQYEWWRLDSSQGGRGGERERLTNTANLFYLGSRFIF